MATATTPPAPVVDAPALPSDPAADPAQLATTLALVAELARATDKKDYRAIKLVTSELAHRGKSIVPEMLGALPLVAPCVGLTREIGKDGLRYTLEAQENKLVCFQLFDVTGDDAMAHLSAGDVRLLIADLTSVLAEVERVK